MKSESRNEHARNEKRSSEGRFTSEHKGEKKCLKTELIVVKMQKLRQETQTDNLHQNATVRSNCDAKRVSVKSLFISDFSDSLVLLLHLYGNYFRIVIATGSIFAAGADSHVIRFP